MSPWDNPKVSMGVRHSNYSSQYSEEELNITDNSMKAMMDNSNIQVQTGETTLAMNSHQSLQKSPVVDRIEPVFNEVDAQRQPKTVSKKKQ